MDDDVLADSDSGGLRMQSTSRTSSRSTSMSSSVDSVSEEEGNSSHFRRSQGGVLVLASAIRRKSS